VSLGRFTNTFNTLAYAVLYMPETTTIRVFPEDRDRIGEIADAKGQNIAETVADLIREPTFVCPECGEPFDAEEIDAETIEEHGVLSSDAAAVVRGERTVKDFECPSCSERVRPDDLEHADTGNGGVTARDIGVSEGNDTPDSEDGQEFTAEEA